MSEFDDYSPAASQSYLNKTRKDKFLLVLNLPPILKDIGRKVRTKEGVHLDSLQFSIFGTVTPRVAVPEKTVRFAGQALQVSSHSRDAYNPIDVNFTVDNRFTNWWIIWKWLDVLNDAKQSTYNSNNLASDHPTLKKDFHEYMADFTVFIQDENEKRIMKMDYIKAFPTALGEISWSYRDPNEAESSFSFAFSQFLPTPIED